MENSVKENTSPKANQDDEKLSQVVQWFEAAETASQTARREATRARDYVNGHQLTEAERQALQKRGQPPVVMNRIRRKIEFLLGLEVKQRTDPKAFPRTPQHTQGAEAITDALRYVCDNADWDQRRTQVYSDMLVEGFGGVEVVHKANKRGEVEVVINQYPNDRLFYDPHSRKDDFSDARYKGVVLWMDYQDFKKKFPDAPDISETMRETGSAYDDKPADIWFDRSRKRVRVILMWYRENGWKYCQFFKGQILDSGESPYLDEEGDTVCPLIMQSMYLDQDNDRYGIVRDMFDPQDEVNKRRSKALHQSTMRQILMSKDAGDVNKVRRELARPDGVVQLEDLEGFQILPTGDVAAAHLSLMQEAKDEIDMMGANSALAGDTGESASGRAVLARQQGGMVEIAHNIDKLHRFTREVYEHAFLRIRQFWTSEKWVRVTDEEQNAKFVGFNRPIPFGEYLGSLPEEEAAMIAQQMGLVPNDPRLMQPIDIENKLDEIDVDIVIEEVPDRVTLQGEMFEALTKYAQAGAIPPQVLIEADPSLTTKKKEKLLELMSQSEPTPKEQLDIAAQEAEIMKTQAETAQIANSPIAI